jgi:hypothetical protein
VVTSQWFEFAGAGLRWPDTPFGYICPLCLAFFPPECASQLTREHAPPRAMGGTVVTFTCLVCNNHAGVLLDHEMKNLEVPLDFHQSTMPQPVQSTLRFAGVTQHVTMQAQKSNRGGTSTAIEGETARQDRMAAGSVLSSLRRRGLPLYRAD